MSCHPHHLLALLAAGLIAAAGCNLLGPTGTSRDELEHYKELARGAMSADIEQSVSSEFLIPAMPRTVSDGAVPPEYWDLSLDEAVQTAVARSSVLRDLGGTVLRSPATTRTIVGPAIQATDPRFGMEGALAAFDATLNTSVYAEKNDRMLNNFVASGGTRSFQQDLITFQTQLSKMAAAGTLMTIRGTSIYDANNASFNKFPSVWDTLVDAEVRQPLLQGAGANFNRIAGPNAIPGVTNGVVVARVNTDIGVADFEIGLRDLASNVENAYWDLYFAYRDLQAKKSVRDAALEVWRRIDARKGEEGGLAEREAQAREQYFRYEEEVQNALGGKLQDATTTNNGTSGGSFRGTGGVLVCERRLRLAMGLEITDNRLIRPLDEPTLAAVKFAWEDSATDAMFRRPELKRQRLTVKRRQLELVASRNFLLPRLDIVSRYRFRGLGHGLTGSTVVPPDPADPANQFANSSINNLLTGDFQEWQLGGELTVPVGYRRAYAGVRNAQLQLAREEAVLNEQERQVVHDLSNAVAEVDRAHALMQTSFNRRVAAEKQIAALRVKLDKDPAFSLEQLMDAERRRGEAEIQFHRACVEHSLALKNVHFEKGTLLEYCNIQLAEALSATPSAQPRAITPSEPPPAVAPPQPVPAGEMAARPAATPALPTPAPAPARRVSAAAQPAASLPVTSPPVAAGPSIVKQPQPAPRRAIEPNSQRSNLDISAIGSFQRVAPTSEPPASTVFASRPQPEPAEPAYSKPPENRSPVVATTPLPPPERKATLRFVPKVTPSTINLALPIAPPKPSAGITPTMPPRIMAVAPAAPPVQRAPPLTVSTIPTSSVFGSQENLPIPADARGSQGNVPASYSSPGAAESEAVIRLEEPAESIWTETNRLPSP